MKEVTSLVPIIRERNKTRQPGNFDTQIKGFPIKVYTEVRANGRLKSALHSKSSMMDLIEFAKHVFIGRMSIELHDGKGSIHFHTREGEVYMVSRRSVILHLAQELRQLA
jgi:hypothetical protein